MTPAIAVWLVALVSHVAEEVADNDGLTRPDIETIITRAIANTPGPIGARIMLLTLVPALRRYLSPAAVAERQARRDARRALRADTLDAKGVAREVLRMARRGELSPTVVDVLRDVVRGGE